MANYGFKISAPGDDVKVAAFKDLKLNSEKGAFKIFKSGDASLTTDGSGNGLVTIAHNLDYPPGILVLRKATARWDEVSGATEYANAFFPVGSFNQYVKGDDLHHAIHAYADETNIYIQVDGGTPSLAMNFRYFILVDQSAAFSDPDNISLVNDYGIKMSKPGFPVLTAKEYQMAFSSKYKIVQYYAVNKTSQALTLPEMFASAYDDFVEEATYVDIEHGLGYAPLCAVFADSPNLGNVVVKAPITFTNGLDSPSYTIAWFCDVTRLRVFFWRSSMYALGTLYDNWPAETITIRANILTENLAGAAFPP